MAFFPGALVPRLLKCLQAAGCLVLAASAFADMVARSGPLMR